MYAPMSLEINQIVLELQTKMMTFTYVEGNTYQISIGEKFIHLTEEEIKAIHYAYQKIENLRKYNNEPQGN